jgi:hypothetical protein
MHRTLPFAETLMFTGPYAPSNRDPADEITPGVLSSTRYRTCAVTGDDLRHSCI